MNFNWKRMESSDYDIVDKWDSEDIREFITIDNAFSISEFYVMFGFYDNRTSYKALDEDGKIIGIILYDNCDYKDVPSRQFNLQLFIVNPEFVNKGYGTRMLQDIIEKFKDEADIFRIESEKNNYACQRICEKNGFTRNKFKERISNYIQYELNLKKLDKQEIKSKKRK